jgi:hypothetical protein
VKPGQRNRVAGGDPSRTDRERRAFSTFAPDLCDGRLLRVVVGHRLLATAAFELVASSANEHWSWSNSSR